MILPAISVPHVTLSFALPGNFPHDTPKVSQKDGLPLYLASHGVQGNLCLKYSEAAFPFCSKDIVKITLNGSYSIRKPCAGPSVVQRYSQLQSSFLDLTNVSRVVNGETPKDELQIGFSFTIPTVVSHLTTSFDGRAISNAKNRSQWSSIPSSLLAESVLSSDMNGGSQRVHAKITYTIQARVFRHGRPIGDASHAVCLYNDTDVQPPTCLTDFPTEYRCSQQRSLKKHLRKTGISLTATVTEPAPFVFRSKEDSAVTILPVRVIVRMPGGLNSDSGQKTAEPVTATFTWQLKCLTFLSVQPLTSTPITVLHGRPTTVSMITVTGPKHQLQRQLSVCKDACVTGGKSSDDLWTDIMKLPLFIVKHTLPAPPVFTPFIARRYNLVLWVKLEGPQSGKTSLQLEVPVQIVYQLEKATLDSIGLPPPYESWEGDPENDHAAMEAPIYSP